MPIDKQDLVDYLRTRFLDRIHAQTKYVSDIVDELSKEGINTIDDLDELLKNYPPNEYLPQQENEIGIRLSDVGAIRSLLVARRIDKINKIIDSWGPLPAELKPRRDPDPFVSIGRGIASYLVKSGDRIKILTTNAGELNISYDELGNRIGMGLPYLRRLESRLESFRAILSSETRAEA
jgi:hypothetical protein